MMPARPMARRLARAASVLAFAFAALAPSDVAAFAHVVQPGETLASLATRFYGDPKLEGLLAAANGLDAEGGVSPVPGMRLEVPSPSYHRVTTGEAWPDLASRFLGSASRADVLARANDAVPWVPPERGEAIVVPYVLAVVATDADRLDTLAKRFWGDPNRAWELDLYNARKGAPLKRGELVLLPITKLPLTDEAKSEARAASGAAGADAGATVDDAAELAFAAQARAAAAAAEMPALLRSGRYAEAAVRASRALGDHSGLLAPKEEAPLLRALVEALVALDAREEATRACLAWRAVDKGARLDPVRTSPKVRAACQTR